LNGFPSKFPRFVNDAEHIPLLVHYFMSKLSRRMRKSIKTIPDPAMDALTNWPWQSKFSRVLQNFIERAVILSQGEELNVPLEELKTHKQAVPPSPTSFEEAERTAIIDALKACSGKLSGPGGAAGRLRLNRSTLQNKMRRLGIQRKDYGR
jgi:formate hydrogenlyase transcriptional activator